MKLLYIHADYLRYWTRRKAKSDVIEELTEDRKKGEIENPLVVFTAVEKSDEYQKKTIIEKVTDDILNLAPQIKPSAIVIYPFAHLSNELASGGGSLEILKSIEVSLKEKGFTVHRTPFGWYKSFELKCKGHPLSELSRTI